METVLCPQQKRFPKFSIDQLVIHMTPWPQGRNAIGWQKFASLPKISTANGTYIVLGARIGLSILSTDRHAASHAINLLPSTFDCSLKKKIFWRASAWKTLWRATSNFLVDVSLKIMECKLENLSVFNANKNFFSVPRQNGGAVENR